MTIDLTEEDIRVLQYVADRGAAGITTDRAVARYLALAKAGLLEHQSTRACRHLVDSQISESVIHREPS